MVEVVAAVRVLLRLLPLALELRLRELASPSQLVDPRDRFCARGADDLSWR